jgi:hypothetical protein
MFALIRWAGYCRTIFQVFPPSPVTNAVPPGIVTVAWEASVAVTEVQSGVAFACCVGLVMRVQWAPPSVVRRIVPFVPETQQTSFEGADPASRSLVTPLSCFCHVCSDSVDFSILPPCPMRQITSPFSGKILTSPPSVVCKGVPEICAGNKPAPACKLD